MSTAPATNPASPLSAADAEQLDRLLALREKLEAERVGAMSPAVKRALETADYYLFLALGYFGYSDRLFPEQE